MATATKKAKQAPAASHTPGPWSAEERSATTAILDHGGFPLGEIYGRTVRGLGVEAANARLVAAAPELLDTLTAIVRAWESISEKVQVPDEINVDDLWNNARNAMARAVGGLDVY